MASTVIGASRQQQDRGSLVETETEAEAVKILPQGCLEALASRHHITDTRHLWRRNSPKSRTSPPLFQKSVPTSACHSGPAPA